MGYRIVVASKAAQDLREILRYVSSHDPVAAHRLRAYLVQEIKLVGDFERAGRMVPEFRIETIRELIRSPYRIIYRIIEHKQIIEVLRFWHAARGVPKI